MIVIVTLIYKSNIVKILSNHNKINIQNILMNNNGRKIPSNINRLIR